MPVPVVQTPSGMRLVEQSCAEVAGRTVAYCRVSSGDQRADLDRQVSRVVQGAGSYPFFSPCPASLSVRTCPTPTPLRLSSSWTCSASSTSYAFGTTTRLRLHTTAWLSHRTGTRRQVTTWPPSRRPTVKRVPEWPEARAPPWRWCRSLVEPGRRPAPPEPARGRARGRLAQHPARGRKREIVDRAPDASNSRSGDTVTNPCLSYGRRFSPGQRTGARTAPHPADRRKREQRW
ncbi:hypothetical protein QF037_009067 [Streptomyces canus]|nr:hypothetical protein [Streptomyces canus]